MSGRFSSHFSLGIRRLVFRVCLILATTSEFDGDMLRSGLCSVSEVAADVSMVKENVSDICDLRRIVDVMGKILWIRGS